MEQSSSSLPAPAIDGPWRVDSYGAKIVPARNRQGFEDLKLIEHSTFAIYGPFSDLRLLDGLKRILSWSARQKDSIIFSAAPDRLLINDKEKSLPMLGDSDSGSFLEYLRSLRVYGESYRNLLLGSKRTWSPNGRYLLGIIPFSSADLRDPELLRELKAILELAEATTLRPLLILENSNDLPPEIQDSLSWQLFVGSEEIGRFRDRYAIEPEPGMKTRQPLGVALEIGLQRARVVNGLGYEPTIESLERKQAIASDAESYRKFLEDLTDGS